MNYVYSLRAETSKKLPPYSDKSILPQSVLSNILDSHGEANLPHPLIFKISNQEDGKHAYIGVREFSSPEEDLIEIPSLIAAKLGGANEVTIQLFQNVPKATMLKIKPLQFYSDISSWKFFFENKLCSFYTVLSKDDKLTIEDNNLRYELIVEDLNEKVACIIDTDVILDVVPLNDYTSTQQLEFNKISNNIQNVIEITNVVELYDLRPFSNKGFIPTMYKIDLTKYKNKLYVCLESLKTDGSDSIVNIDLVMGFDKLISIENFRYTTMNQDFQIQHGSDKNNFNRKKLIEIDLRSDEIVNKLSRYNADDEDGELEKWIYLVPFSWEFDSDIQISISEEPSTEDNKMEDQIMEGYKLCSNCDKQIPDAQFVLHETFCIRNNIKCSCGVVFFKEIPTIHWHCDKCDQYGNSSLKKLKHDNLLHQTYKCDKCDLAKTFPDFVTLVSEHKGLDCPKKLHECKFCHLIVPQGEATYQDNFENLTNHENSCGNKTTECFKCSKILRRKDLAKHLKLHDLEKIQLNHMMKLSFSKCSNQNCVKILSDTPNPLMLCDLCYGPFYISQQDPTNIKLQARIERKYFIQLSKGCGNSWCNNEYCITANNSLLIKGQPIRQLISFIQENLLSHISSLKLPINNSKPIQANMSWFCVNESISTKKLLLEIIMSEKLYDEEIVVKAVNLYSDEANVRAWLHENAIKRI